ncbi:MAG: hypothetical protein LBG79_07235 [Spirochaetaceae bacterium]|jgi:hypothetical protein|nr:hypothetical protein [Spirochaetaceae bacterium]
MLIPDVVKCYEKVIETRSAGSSVSSRKRYLFEMLNELGMEKLRKIPFARSHGRESPKTKAQYISVLSDFLAFGEQAHFDAWIKLFEPVAQKILRDTVSERFCILIKYQNEINAALLPAVKKFSSAPVIMDELNLGFLNVYYNGIFIIIGIADSLRNSLLPWIKLPPESQISNCAVSLEKDAVVFSNIKDIADSWSLLCEALNGEVTKYEVLNNLKPFSKKQLAALRTKCGFKNFLSGGIQPDALDMAARFILCMSEAEPKRPNNGQLDIKNYINDFFNSGKKPNNWKKSIKLEYLEQHVLTDHLRRRGNFYFFNDDIPDSRALFYKILMIIAKDGRWFSADALAKYILYNEKKFSFLNYEAERSFFIKASMIKIDDVNIEYDSGDYEFTPTLLFHFYLLARPLFKAYCYLFAALGLLEITQTTAEPAVVSGGNAKPFSPYDSLDSLRITNFGKWCLGLIENPPDSIQEKYEAIADKELLLVTVRGKSFERSLFLDEIGIKLGEDRWRISPRSFISGCTDITQIEERIKKFKRLIDVQSMPHWEQLFSKIMRRANFSKTAITQATVFKLGEDRELLEELFADPAFSSCALRAEGLHIIVPDKHKKKFLDLLAEHGVAYF